MQPGTSPRASRTRRALSAGRHVAGILLASGVAWAALGYVHRLSDELTLRPKRCEISGLLGNCPAQPDFRIARQDGMLIEMKESAQALPGCLRRAREFHEWCRADKPIVARFFEQRRMVGETSFPDADAARCEISGLPGNCPAQPTLRITRQDGVLLEAAEIALQSPAGCFQRAKEYHEWCRAEKPIVARFMRGTRLVEERSLPQAPATRCEIVGLRDNCPGQPTFAVTRQDGVLLEQAPAALQSQAGCFQRADDYRAWCGARTPIVARFFAGSDLVAERAFPE